MGDKNMTEQERDSRDSRENRQNPESPENASASERPARAPRLRAERMQEIPAHLEGCAALEKLCFREPWSAHSLELLCTDGIGVGFLCTGSIPPGGGQGPVALQELPLRLAQHLSPGPEAVLKEGVGVRLQAVEEPQQHLLLGGS